MQAKGKLAILKNWRSIEQISYLVVWGILAFLPLIFWDFDDGHERRRIIGGWIRILPFFIVFLVHHFLLLPKLLLKKRYLTYFLLTLVVILLVNYGFFFSDFIQDKIIALFERKGDDVFEGIERFRQGRQNPDRAGSHGPFRGTKGSRYWRWHNPAHLLYTYNVLISILIVGFNSTLKFASHWMNREQERRELEKENIESRLSALQNQISPHFFMNTLNNIHALIDYDREDAKQAVLRLSKMMRYLLYESDHGKTSLLKEVDFIQSYIDLMKLRLQPEVELKVILPDPVPDVEVYSLTTLSFLENAFKHGINPKGLSYIYILLEQNDEMMHFNVRNSKAESGDLEMESGGIGIENARQRLKILYGETHTLEIYDRPDEFEVDLLFPIA